MGNNEDEKSCKPEKSSSTAPDQSNIHVYPDWTAMQLNFQAYYGPRLAVPPYANSALAPGHAPHSYMWGPLQAMMPPYGTPYAGIYAHGGVYPHPGVPIDTASLSLDASAKSSGNTDQGLTSQLKGPNGLGMSIGNCSVDNGDGSDNGPSQSGQEGSSDGSNIDTTEVAENSKKRSRETTPNNCKGFGLLSHFVSECQSSSVDIGVLIYEMCSCFSVKFLADGGKRRTLRSPQPTREVNVDSEKGTSVTVNPGNTAEKYTGTVFSPTTMELRNPVGTLLKPSPTNVSQMSPAVPGEAWLQNERELKREKRKQSNRESARRSRLRKQAETEELAMLVQSLTSENLALKSEINKFTANSEKLKVENAALMARLKNKQEGQAEEVTLGKIDDKRLQHVSTANLIVRVNNNGPLDRTNEDAEVHENNNTSGAKLHQLLDASPRTDAVAAR
ncbi:hypothetical protein RND71_026219 [Anisodus tanguticus]|uniref:BZIP domain-containing protein n=1 Tax=Anisodus tanguticus TaxID=243964 RepID=A0AAE1VB41_9SOLA|nr:hypothetical protein RND71_026219 [Anisodus tanguticus]